MKPNINLLFSFGAGSAPATRSSSHTVHESKLHSIARSTSKSTTLLPETLNLWNIFISANRFCCPPERDLHRAENCSGDSPPLCDAFSTESNALASTSSCASSACANRREYKRGQHILLCTFPLRTTFRLNTSNVQGGHHDVSPVQPTAR